MRPGILLAMGIVAASFLLAGALYPSAPDRIPSHWNAKGEVDGSLDKPWGLFLLPLVSAALLLLFLAIPRIDPLKENIARFRGAYDGLVVLVMAFLLYVHLLILAWAFGGRFPMIQLLAPAIGILFIAIGGVLPRTRRNWFVGIRTPWTLSSDRVWERTHRWGGKLFLVSGIAAILGSLTDQAIWFLLLPVIASAVILAVYSFLAYRQEEMSTRNIRHQSRSGQPRGGNTPQSGKHS